MLIGPKTRAFLSRHPLPVLATLGVAITLFIILLSPTFQLCMGVNQYQEANHTKYERATHFIWTLYWCGGIFFRENGEAITALATLVMAVFTGTLWRATSNQGKIAQQSIDLARDEFLVTHRPHLIVRNVHAVKPQEGGQVAIKFEVINAGFATAYHVASAFKIETVADGDTFQNLHFVQVGEPPRRSLKFNALLPSAVFRGILKPPGLTWSADQLRVPDTSEAGVFFAGKILYRDIDGRQRRLGILRRLGRPSRRFHPVEDAEFEYDD